MQVVNAYTDIYHPILGDWNGKPILRPVTLTFYDGNKTARGVIDGTVMIIPIKRIYRDRNRSKMKPKYLSEILET